jgi:hypothetical protein
MCWKTTKKWMQNPPKNNFGGSGPKPPHAWQNTDTTFGRAKNITHTQRYWVEVINYENYILNHTATKALKNISLEEVLTKMNPYVSHLCVFGSIA